MTMSSFSVGAVVALAVMAGSAGGVTARSSSDVPAAPTSFEGLIERGPDARARVWDTVRHEPGAAA